MTTAIVPPKLAALADLPDDALIGIGPMSALYSCSGRHIYRASDAGLIPAPIRVGRIVRWRIGTIREHIRGGCRPVRQTARG